MTFLLYVVNYYLPGCILSKQVVLSDKNEQSYRHRGYINRMSFYHGNIFVQGFYLTSQLRLMEVIK